MHWHSPALMQGFSAFAMVVDMVQLGVWHLSSLVLPQLKPTLCNDQVHSIEELEHSTRGLISQRHVAVVDGVEEMLKLLSASNRAVKINK